MDENCKKSVANTQENGNNGCESVIAESDSTVDSVSKIINGSKSEVSDDIDVVASSNHDNPSSLKSKDNHSIQDDQNSSPIPDGKRQKNQQSRPSSPGFSGFLGGIPASPPKFIALEEIMKAAKGVSNLCLAHEIAVDKNFRIEKIGTPKNPIQSQVEEIVRKAFWDVLQSQLNESPPNFKQALILLKEIKETLLSLLLPQHTRLKQEIEEILDIQLVKQQAENGALDFQRYAQYVLSVMARLCAPVQDEKIKDLTQTQDVVPLFKGIMDLLDLMKLDMANFTIQQLRPHIEQNSVEYERTKFTEFLKTQSECSPNIDGLEYTKKWLKRNYDFLDLSHELNSNDKINKTLNSAFVELLVWDEKNEKLYPETLLIDKQRLDKLRDDIRICILAGSILLITFATVGSSIQGLTDFKENLKNHLKLIFEDKTIDQKDTDKSLESAAIQTIQDVDLCLEKHGFKKLDDSKRTLLNKQIIEISNPENRIRIVVQRRILEFVESVMMSPTAVPVKIPTGLSAFQDELSTITGQFIQISSHNRAVFSEYYADIITEYF